VRFAIIGCDMKRALATGPLSLLALAAVFGSLSASIDATCVDQDAGDPDWDGVCSYLAEQPSFSDECAILIGQGMPAGLCCACSTSEGQVTLSELQKMLPELCKV